MRVFFALTFEEKYKKKIVQYRDLVANHSLKGRFTIEENFHLTLEFIGEVSTEEIEELCNILPKLSLYVDRINAFQIGSFKRRDREIVWLGLKNNKMLHLLHQELVHELESRDYNVEKRRYTPHITLGRQVLMNQDVRELLIEPYDIPIKSIALMESKRVEDKLVYEVIEEMKPFPMLETNLLKLRKLSLNDVQDIFEMRSNSKMHEYTDTIPDKTLEDTKAYIQKMNQGVDDEKWMIWAIEHMGVNKVIGSISIWNINEEEKSAELGYGITPDFQGNGYMKEALQKAVQYGFDHMNLNYLDAYTEVENTISNRLLEKCGFTEVDRVDDKGYYSDRVYHMIVYRKNNYTKI